MSDEIKAYILWWNNKFPVDRWWREKHNIPFLSPRHKAMSLIDIFIEYEEEVLFANYRNQIQTKQEDRYVPGSGQILKKRFFTQEQIEEQFENINLDDYDSPELKQKRHGRSD